MRHRTPNSFTDIATISRQVGCKRLFEQYDELGVPAAPGNVSAKFSAGPPPENIITWSEPAYTNEASPDQSLTIGVFETRAAGR